MCSNGFNYVHETLPCAAFAIVRTTLVSSCYFNHVLPHRPPYSQRQAWGENSIDTRNTSTMYSSQKVSEMGHCFSTDQGCEMVMKHVLVVPIP